MTTAEFTPARDWQEFRLELELAKNYPRPHMMYVLRTHRNPILERLLPVLLHVRAVALLDDTLDQLMAEQGLELPRKYRPSLHGRIEFLADQGILSNREQLHSLRTRRNHLAHGHDAVFSWAQLDADVNLIEDVLVKLSMVRPTGELEFYMERSALRASDRPGYAYQQDFKYGLKENGKPAIEVAWSESMELPTTGN